MSKVSCKCAEPSTKLGDGGPRIAQGGGGARDHRNPLGYASALGPGFWTDPGRATWLKDKPMTPCPQF